MPRITITPDDVPGLCLKWLEARQLPYRKLAQAMDTSETTLSRWINGHQLPQTFKHLARLEEFFRREGIITEEEPKP